MQRAQRAPYETIVAQQPSVPVSVISGAGLSLNNAPIDAVAEEVHD